MGSRDDGGAGKRSITPTNPPSMLLLYESDLTSVYFLVDCLVHTTGLLANG
jgi:hypothetical protein